MSDEPTKIILSHPGADTHEISFDPLKLRDDEWLKRVLFIPWATPQRLIGFVHPEADKLVGKSEFLLQGAFSYYAQVGVQAVGNDKLRVVEGPRIALPYDLVSPLDIHIGACPTWVWVHEQGAGAKEFFKRLLLQQLMPQVIEAPPSPALVVP